MTYPIVYIIIVISSFNDDRSIMGKFSRSKGARVERELVNKLRDTGIYAERVPLSGAAGGSFSGDVIIPLGLDGKALAGITELRCEVKARSNGAGFTQLERWKADNDLLFLKRDRTEPMVVMDWDLFTQLLSSSSQRAFHVEQAEDDSYAYSKTN